MRLAWLCAVMAVFAACRTPRQLPPVDLSQPGWQVRQGQAVWKADTKAPEIAGEFVWARHRDGAFLLQFLKTPITLVEAQGTAESWQISFPARERILTGSWEQPPPQRLGWLHLAQALLDRRLGAKWTFEASGEKWRLANGSTGEVIEGYLRP